MVFARRFITILTASLLAFALASCSSDDGDPTDPGTTPPDSALTYDVTISTGLWEAVAGQGFVTDIPAAVTDVRFTFKTDVSARYEDVPVGVGAQTVQLVMQIPADRLARLECRGMDAGGATLFQGVGFINQVQENDTAVINLVDASDTTTPTMNGALTATPLSNQEILLEWEPATEGGDEAVNAIYMIWVEGWPTHTKDGELPWTVTMAGMTSLVVRDPFADTQFDFTVKAVDPAGNDSENSLTASATPLGVDIGVYVDATIGVDDPDCGEIGDPCRSITQALDHSDPGDPIYISRGLYNAANGETFPLVLKDGTRLLGDLAWPRGVPLSVIEAGTVDAVIEVPVNGSFSGLWIDNSAGGAGRIVDARTGNLRMDRVHVEGLNSYAAIHAGADAVIRNTHIEGLTAGRGIATFGNGAKDIAGCIIENCQMGISVNGLNTDVHMCLVQDCTTGLYAWGSGLGETGDLTFSRLLVLDCGNGIDLQVVDEVSIKSSVIWRSTQMGIHLMDTDDTVRVLGCHIDGGDLGGNTGVYVRRGYPVINNSTLVCSRVNLFVEGPDLVTCTGNHWYSNPPVVTERQDDEPCADSDICYDYDYSGTPEPVWSPNYSRSSCLVIGIMPQPTVVELPGLLDRVRSAVE